LPLTKFCNKPYLEYISDAPNVIDNYQLHLKHQYANLKYWENNQNVKKRKLITKTILPSELGAWTVLAG